MNQRHRYRRNLVAFRHQEQTDEVLVDAHVHIHGCFPLSIFLDSACRNFNDAAISENLRWPCHTVLLLTESAGADFYRSLRQQADTGACSIEGDPGAWRFESTAETSSLLAHRGDAEHIFIIAGRQIVTGEGLEVLALCTDQHFGDGDPTLATVKAVRDAGAIAVIPWGFGKWLGRRGRILTAMLKRVHETPFLLGDTSHRLRGLPPPKALAVAKRKGVRILPGTDPLPFPSQVSRPGSYGFRMAGALSLETPAADLKALIATRELIPYGRGEGLARFAANQVAMQIRKQRPARSGPSTTGQG